MKLDSTAFVADEALLASLRDRATLVDCSQDRTLFRQGQEPFGLFILHSGEAVMRIETPSGEEVVLMRATPGSLLGLPGLIGNKAYSMSAHANKGAVVSFVSREEFSKLMLGEPSLALSILRVLAAEVRTARVAMANA